MDLQRRFWSPTSRAQMCDPNKSLDSSVLRFSIHKVEIVVTVCTLQGCKEGMKMLACRRHLQ